MVLGEGGGQTLWAGRYRIERLLGEGERKQVYLAYDSIVRRDVALALIEPEEPMGGLTLTQWECQVTARLGQHPHIVTLYDLGECDGQSFMVSQYMRGGDLRGVLRRARSEDRPLPLGTVLRYGSEISDALAFAHDHTIVHRDVQPGNVWLDEPEGAAHLGDVDLALTPDAPAALANPNAVVTTRAYMPPEEARGERVDARGDLYSLGATLYELAVGRPPFEGSPREIVEQHLESEARPPSALRTELPERPEALIIRLLAKDPSDRPQTSTEVHESLAALRHALGGDEVDIDELMARGEGSRLEFKSSLRYDLKKGEKNPALETVVAKTVAGFMNAEADPPDRRRRRRSGGRHRARLGDAEVKTNQGWLGTRLHASDGEAPRP